MDEKRLSTIIEQRIGEASTGDSGDVSQKRQDVYNRYRGRLYGTEQRGFSSFVTRQVLEVIEWALPPLVKMFLGSNRVVSFEPVGPEDEPLANQETEVVNHKVLKANGGDGFLALYTFIKDTLMAPTAYAKVFLEDEKRVYTREKSGIPEHELPVFDEDPNIEIIEQSSEIENIEIDGQLIQQEFFSIKYKETVEKRNLMVESVPPEEIVVDGDLTSTNLDKADFVCHKAQFTLSELVRMGFDKDRLEDLPGGESYADFETEERYNRQEYVDQQSTGAGRETDPSQRKLWCYEAYMWVDFDGDGEAEFRKVVMIEREIFENEETDYQPFVASSSILVPHSHHGLSIGELAMDLQRLGTTLVRSFLDNVYRMNVRRKFLSAHALLPDNRTWEALMNPQAEIVPVQGSVRDVVSPDSTTPILKELLPAIHMNDKSVSLRTGINPENNIDPAVLQQATKGAFMGAMDKASERLELIARVLAETGFKQLFLKVHQLIRTHPDIAETVKLRNKWVPIDARSWKDRTDVNISVGLGFANKEQTGMALMNLLGVQKELMGENMASHENLHHTVASMIETAGLGSPESFLVDPGREGWQPPQRPLAPEAVELQARAEFHKMHGQSLVQGAQTTAQKTMGTLEAEKARLQMEIQKNDMDMENLRLKGMLEGKELEIRERDQQLQETRAEIENIKTMAEVEEIGAKGNLYEAQAEKNRAEVGNKEADAELKGSQAVNQQAQAALAPSQEKLNLAKALDAGRPSAEPLPPGEK